MHWMRQWHIATQVLAAQESTLEVVAKLFDRTASSPGAWTVERCTVDDAGDSSHARAGGQRTA